ncbi:MAG: hypothetical protein A2504_14360 [Bdellovibrionales bacterium RIFOXYD12_FULL_39_22]|nr:MAG: hypothetical protein A2385_04795 [Bdellovibrionales bacterium RIFOXYB1_FULL_39_21]OFZ43466.1 MAG: hypothetical protein A2485_13310 [Bdellovibrionales bacterium RIFOXYC12_FULL_39_17]OFZ47009.1 MAG: hypothetical protein A2404_00370 [Bdellovibrionales bacterium RIFOXYC1_FULL_39_130]OFZ76206.1 MAG: hypothetical protein A2560_07620 [Bdellovibrionales bacterium RIFOXYD1_FULL_39_84]OFZ94441.1 MAG: hypothetical protein A2504_14360 [Bdellovibrionales bacterium RIFOXYD12_FULL_39_22]HLE10518.1 se
MDNTRGKLSKNISKNFTIISFIPAFAYWYLEANYSVAIAVSGGLVLATLELAGEWFFTKHLHSISKINFFLIIFLGALSLLEGEGVWFKLQPAITGIGIGMFVGIKSRRGVGPLAEMLNDLQQKNLPPYLVKILERDIAIFFTAYGLFMVIVALALSSGKWLFFKTGGFYLAFILFMAFEIIMIRRKVRQVAFYEQRRQLLSAMKVNQDSFDKIK